ncbi:amidohydrolase [Lacibacter sp. H407]|uniref:amidohydrolase n=1 Tax=Lacibacter sp. H407 TaxID=3133423 RepID=UPI0030C58EF6
MLRIILLLSITTIAFLSFKQDRSTADAVDLVVLNGRIFTGNEQQPFAEAMAVRKNRIVAIGTTVDIKAMIGSSTKQYQLNGKLVIPGFNDAHIHFLSGSLGLSTVDLNQSKTPEEAVAEVVKYAKKNPSAKWITGLGWQYTIFPGGMPTKEMLDAVISDRPVYIRAYDGHSAWVNSKALQLAGITKETSYTGFGSIVKDAKGEPTGALSEGAMQLVAKFIPPITREEKLAAIKKGLQYAASLGITSVQNASGSIDEFELYNELYTKGELTLRYAAAFSANKNTKPEDIAQYVQLKNKFKGNRMLTADAIKFMLDGVIESHTAVMMDDYSDAGEDGKTKNGTFALPLETYRLLVSAFDKAGFRIYTHAIGDRSVHEALNAYEAAQKQNNSTGTRHRVEHIEQCKPEDVQRFLQLNVLPSMQPIHADPATIAVWAKAVGEQRLPFSFAWQSMLQSKATLVFGSDWPACIDLNPIHGLHVAANRQTTDGLPTGGWIPQQRIGMKEALLAYTNAGAYSSFEETDKGKLLPGYLADFVVLSQDLFSIPTAAIHQTNVLLTVVDGREVFKAAKW